MMTLIDADYGALAMLLTASTSGNVTNGEAEGLDLSLLFGGIGLFLAIVVAITILRRWR